MKRTHTRAIVIHTTASQPTISIAQIQAYFLKVLRWGRGGYHLMYAPDGSRQLLYDWRSEVTYGILPSEAGDLSNFNTIHLSYIGGISQTSQNDLVCNITLAQEKAMLADIRQIMQFYQRSKIIGHNQINRKGCPSFWVPRWAKARGIDPQRIDERDPFGMQDFIWQNVPHPLGFYEPKNLL
jgi:hypothetical protein